MRLSSKTKALRPIADIPALAVYSLMVSSAYKFKFENHQRLNGMLEKEIDPCVVCNEEQAKTLAPDFDGIHQICPRCGEFKVSGTALAVVERGLGKDKRAKLSGWVFEQNRAGAIPMITTANIDNIFARPLPTVIERATSLLQEAQRGLQNLGDQFNITEPRFLAATFSSNRNDVEFLLNLLREQGLAATVSLDGWCEILPNGYMRLDEARMQAHASAQGFVAMWFHEDLNNVYVDGFQVGIMRAGYNPIRIDRLEHVNKIDDEIIRQLKLSRFVVADFTGHRGGVYFEAGFALGLNKPVFWTCKKSDMNELHFDIRQFNCIDWETSEDLADRLASRLEAVLGQGPNIA